MPVRRAGWSGLVPLPGWDPANDWAGFATPDELPRARNPQAGYLASANNDLNRLGARHPINLPMGEDRALRIAELLEQRSDWTLGDVLQMQPGGPSDRRFSRWYANEIPDWLAGRTKRLAPSKTPRVQHRVRPRTQTTPIDPRREAVTKLSHRRRPTARRRLPHAAPAIDALITGRAADLLGVRAALRLVAATTAASGLIVATRRDETRHPAPAQVGPPA